MKFECNEGGAFAVIIVGIAAAISAAVIVLAAVDSRVKVECHKAQAAAYAASAPAPDCKP